ncbi:MAG: ATP-grasp domain-containing protein [Promethearchaeota archaeon]|jgi:glutathione synthase/RimK-type ligase-like ATP-grasp enzyme
MIRNVVFSAREDHEIVKGVLNRLKNVPDVNLHFHDPTKKFFNLSRMPKPIKEADVIIVKVRNDCSIDLLHYAKIHKIPTLHDVDTVLMCKNKISLDYALRNVFKKNTQISKRFSFPNSWNNNITNIPKFKKWASQKLPIVIKSHYQHDKYNRFNFLVRNIEEIEIFCNRYKHLLYYDIYIQKFIECDGLERKVYVIGDKVFGIIRDNPIYIYLKEQPDNIDVDTIKRKEFKISKEIRELAEILSNELNLKIFGFDLIKLTDKDRYYLIDLNDFPGFRGIKNIENALSNYLVEFINSI